MPEEGDQARRSCRLNRDIGPTAGQDQLGYPSSHRTARRVLTSTKRTARKRLLGAQLFRPNSDRGQTSNLLGPIVRTRLAH
jgi:hypothetical protein